MFCFVPACRSFSDKPILVDLCSLKEQCVQKSRWNINYHSICKQIWNESHLKCCHHSIRQSKIIMCKYELRLHVKVRTLKPLIKLENYTSSFLIIYGRCWLNLELLQLNSNRQYLEIKKDQTDLHVGRFHTCSCGPLQLRLQIYTEVKNNSW